MVETRKSSPNQKSLFDYPGPLWKLYSVFFGGVLIVSVILWGGLVLLRSLFPMNSQTQDWYLRSWYAFICRGYRFRFEFKGQENHDPAVTSLVISNHQSLFDIPAAFAGLPGHLRMVAKKELFSIPIFGHVMRRLSFISVDRASQTSGREATRSVVHRLKNGCHVWVAPEGTRSRGDEFLPFKKGSFAAAIEAQAPIQPIVIQNSSECWPRGTLLVRPGILVRVNILPRLSTVGLGAQDRGYLCDQTRQLMLSHFVGVDSLRKALPSHNGELRPAYATATSNNGRASTKSGPSDSDQEPSLR